MTDVRSVAWLEAAGPVQPSGGQQGRLDLNIPGEIPGAEAPRIALAKEPDAKEAARSNGSIPPCRRCRRSRCRCRAPGRRPYTLADFQQIAVANSPVLRQAASDVEAARGALITSDAYPNPTLSYHFTPSNDGSTPSADGLGVTQTIKTGGKLGLARASAEMALSNAELALRAPAATFPRRSATPTSPCWWATRRSA